MEAAGLSEMGMIMRKKLSEMSLEELWQLFPVFLTGHEEIWGKWYSDEAERLNGILNDFVLRRISHIGSTSIPTIWAKPIIDILVEAPPSVDLNSIEERLAGNGYICMSRDGNRISLNRGYTEHGFAERVYHLHLRYEGDNDELYFRDYLTEYPEIAKEYERMKMKLWKKYEHDRDAYTNAKSDFVSRYTREAKKLYGRRYGA